MNSEHKKMLEYLENAVINAVIDDNEDLIDFKLTGHSFNTFDNKVYPEFLAIVPSSSLTDGFMYSGYNYIRNSIHDTLEKYNSLFFNNYFTFLPANIKIKINPQV